jgi:sugar phosphate isomerase/epimerase
MDRREFLKSSALAAGAAAGVYALAGRAPAQDAPAAAKAAGAEKKPAVLKLSSQEGLVPGKTLREKVQTLQQWGAAGVELGSNIKDRVAEIKDAVKGTSIAISAICAGYFQLIDPDEAKRKQGAQRLKDLCGPAGEVGSTGIILVPAFNNHDQLPPKEARKVLVDLLPEIGEAARKAGTRILMEPLNRGEAFFLRQLADAASICRDANNPGIGMMGDFFHMCREETSDCGAFLSAGPYLHHVHLASRTRKLPGQDDRSFVDGFRGLKMIGYQGFCSLECGVKGKADMEIPKAFRFLEQQWKEATI